MEFVKQHKVALLAGGSLLVIALIFLRGSSGSSSSPLLSSVEQSNAAAYNASASIANSEVAAGAQSAQETAAQQADVLQTIASLFAVNAQQQSEVNQSNAAVKIAGINANAATTIEANRTAQTLAVSSNQTNAETLANENALSAIENGQNNTFNLGLLAAGTKLAPSVLSGLDSLLETGAGAASALTDFSAPAISLDAGGLATSLSSDVGSAFADFADALS